MGVSATRDPPMRLKLSINAHETWVAPAGELRQTLHGFSAEPFKAIWLGVDDGPKLCALLSSNLGWLMYMTEDGEDGLQSVNPPYAGDPRSVRQYRLSNGQMEEYPESWALAEAA